MRLFKEKPLRGGCHALPGLSGEELINYIWLLPKGTRCLAMPSRACFARYDTLGGGGVSADSTSDKAR